MKIRIEKIPESVKKATQGTKNRAIVLDYIAKAPVTRWTSPNNGEVKVSYNPVSRHYEIEGADYNVKYAASLINLWQ